MHFCKFNLKFVGLGYKPIKSVGTFAFTTFELYKCGKCGKLIFINQSKHEYAVIENYRYAIVNIEKCGYQSLGELVK